MDDDERNRDQVSSAKISAGVIIAILVLLAVRLWGGDDFWRVAVPGYLTGMGTLALAMVTYMLMRREAADRRQLTNADADRQRTLALVEARKVVAVWEAKRPGQLTIVNASAGPILDVKLISAVYGGVWIDDASGQPPTYLWEPRRGLENSYAPVVLSGGNAALGGEWDHPTPNRLPQGTLIASIAWTDPSGVGWRRDGQGEPFRLDQPFAWSRDELTALSG